MRDLSKVLASTALLSVGGIVNGAAIDIQPPINIDLHQQRIGLWNLEEKIDPALPKPSPTSEEIISINLSENVITDEDISKILGMLESHGLMTRLAKLDLSNNRLKFEGVKALIPLLASENLKWLDLSINNLMVNDFQQLWEDIERYARRLSIIEDLANPEELRDKWAAKVILLPSSYTVVERFALQPPFVSAHKQYYQVVR